MKWILAVLWCMLSASAHAGIIHGIVIEAASSRPLSRTRVRLQTISVKGEVQNVAGAFTDRSGQYWFPSLPDGRYLVSATRNGYLEGAFGQRRPLAPGSPIAVQSDSSTFAEIRLRKLGAITGKIVDENFVALPGVNVIAYPAELPLRMSTVAKTDDRGVYRLFGLPAGRYWVRNAAADLDDGGILPTFFPGSMSTREARMVRVDLDADASEIDFQPTPGRLFKMTGRVFCTPPETYVRVTLTSDTGRKEVSTNCGSGAFTFDQLAPNNYEILAEPVSTPDAGAYWGEFTLDRDHDSGTIQLTGLPELDYRIRGKDNAMIPTQNVQVQLRRRDLAGEGPLVPAKRRVLPGYWEIFVRPGPAMAFTRFTTLPPYLDRSSSNLSPLAPLFNVERNHRGSFDIQLSNKPATVNGVVRRAGEAVYRAPVILYPLDADLRRRVHGHQITHTDSDGKFSLTGLPPGDYLIISSTDLEEVNETTLTDAKAKSVSVKEGVTETVMLEPYVVE